MTKPLHAGRAAHSGVLAVRLAQAGVTAAGDCLESSRGLLHAVSSSGKVDIASAATVGRIWRMLEYGMSIKLFPVCFGAHRVLHAALTLRAESPCDPAQIDAVTVEIGRSQLVPLAYSNPQTGSEAKFSAQFAVASAIVSGRCGLAELNDAYVRSLAIQSLMRRVRMQPLDERDPDEPVFSPFDRVSIVRRDGVVLQSRPVARPPGHIRCPASDEALWHKFDDCAAALPAAKRRQLYDALQRIDQLADCSQLPVASGLRLVRGRVVPFPSGGRLQAGKERISQLR